MAGAEAFSERNGRRWPRQVIESGGISRYQYFWRNGIAQTVSRSSHFCRVRRGRLAAHMNPITAAPTRLRPSSPRSIPMPPWPFGDGLAVLVSLGVSSEPSPTAKSSGHHRLWHASIRRNESCVVRHDRTPPPGPGARNGYNLFEGTGTTTDWLAVSGGGGGMFTRRGARWPGRSGFQPERRVCDGPLGRSITLLNSAHSAYCQVA